MYKRIRDLREDHDMTQAQLARILTQSELAEKLNVTRQAVSKYETGENDIPTQILIKLADLYGTSIDYMLGRTEER